ncbi:Zinc finger protein 2-like [Oopsacas minuta]|uniref:Zinc finger protein 2-like n=1 Tax=Oopsacas minuta TaxID=111878 RepID=A0AAV7KGC8_9METZ|nr:Zinc finger protein 2-like [Oopsacas minuta]
MERKFDVFLHEKISEENFSFGTSIDSSDDDIVDTNNVIHPSNQSGMFVDDDIVVKIESLLDVNFLSGSNMDYTERTEIRQNVPFFGFPFEKPLWKYVDVPPQIHIISQQQQQQQQQIEDEIQTTVSQSKTDLQCIFCKVSFDSNHKLCWHQVSCPNNPFIDLDTNKQLVNNCDTCNQSFRSKDDLDYHTCTSKHDKKYSCEICGKTYSNICVKIRHMHSHSNIRPHECDVCHKSFLRKEYLTSHYRVHSGDRPYSCQICGKTFAYTSAKRSHMKLHRTKPYACSICSRNYVSTEKLSLSNSQDSDLKVYTCDRCVKNTETIQQIVETHGVIQTSENSSIPQTSVHIPKTSKENIRNLKCKHCPRVYIRQSDLTKHSRTHFSTPTPSMTTTIPHTNVTNPIPNESALEFPPHIESPSLLVPEQTTFECHLCNRTFNAKRLLVRHVYAHLGIKPYSCSICDKKYARKEDLILHIRTHTGERPFSCDICDKRFIRRRSYKLHRRTHAEGGDTEVPEDGGDVELTDNVVSLGVPEN